MYFANPSADNATNLRQGDILIEIPFFGTVDLARGVLSFHKGLDNTQPNFQFSTNEVVPCIVVSACCEMDRRNNGKSNTVLLAPWRSLGRAGKPEEQVRLKNPNLQDITQASNFRFIWCDAFNDIGLQEGVFDLSAVFSISKGSQDFLLSKRVRSATDDYRKYIKQKIAVFFTRDDA